MSQAAPLEIYRASVQPEWIDYNGHMNVAYYVLVFDYATDAFLDSLGLDSRYRQETGGTTFAVESHVTYQQEVSEGDPLVFTTQLLGFDTKRLRFFTRMLHAEQDYQAATAEWVTLHVDLGQRKVAPFPDPVTERLAKLWSDHKSLPIPQEAGRGLSRPSGAPNDGMEA